MVKSTEVLEEVDARSGADLPSCPEAKHKGSAPGSCENRLAAAVEGSSSLLEKSVELQGVARTASLVTSILHSSVQKTDPVRKALSQKIFELLPEELILWLGVILPLFVLAVGHLAYFSEFGINPIPTVW